MDHNEQIKQGYLYAVRLLTQAKRSEREISKRLSSKGYPDEITEQVLSQLKTQGILSDRKLVEDSLHWSVRAKRYGRNRIFFELRKRGIAETDIQKALQRYSKADEEENARTLALERWTKLEKLEQTKRKRRLYDFLVSRGFDFELVRQVVGEMKCGRDEGI